MAENKKYRIINIRRYIGNENHELGEDELFQILSEFSCPVNPDVEKFLKCSSVDFTKKNQSVTYLVFSTVGGKLLGYFTLALKPLTVRGETVSNTVKKKLLRISELDRESDTYTMSAYLVAQLGKNYSESAGKMITGTELLELAWDKIKETQYEFGGMVVFLEAENKEKLLSFYRNNCFSQFDTRQTTSNKNAPHELVQLLRLL